MTRNAWPNNTAPSYTLQCSRDVLGVNWDREGSCREEDGYKKKTDGRRRRVDK
jgi:hypothetical protein